MDNVPVGFSLRAIRAWAGHNFADDFDQPPGPGAFTIQYNYLVGNDLARRYGLLVGNSVEEINETMSTFTDIFAWLEGSRVTIGYIIQPTPSRKEIRYERMTSPSITSIEPFCWLLPSRDLSAISQFEAFVRYALFIVRGQKAVPTAFKHNWSLLTDHFPSACRMVAEGVAGRLNETDDYELALKVLSPTNEDAPRDADRSDSLQLKPPARTNGLINHNPRVMRLNGYSRFTIDSWAKLNFPSDFDQLPAPRDIHIHSWMQNPTISGSIGRLAILVIGKNFHYENEIVDVLAWLEDNCMIIGYVIHIGTRAKEIRYDSTISVLEGVSEFIQPYC